MTPQERQMVADLFDRLASLEGERRDPDAERMIREGLGHAPNAVYALVQSVLVQDEALKRANARIEALEHAAGGEQAQGGGGFSTPCATWSPGAARYPPCALVPARVRAVRGARGPAPQPGYPPQSGYPQPGYPQQGYPQGAPMAAA